MIKGGGVWWEVVCCMYVVLCVMWVRFVLLYDYIDGLFRL